MQDMYSYLNNKNNGMIWDEELCKRLNNPKCLEKYGFKVYSQNDEDGIIEEIFHRIGSKDKIFIEFGVQDGIESNGHYLLLKGWKGLWIECGEESCKEILKKFDQGGVIESGALTVVHEFIKKDNINQIFADNNFTGEIDLLSIDIDGNDYYVWEAIDIVSPRVVVIEYNSKIPPTCEWIMPYCEQHIWDGGDKHGASLLSLVKLGKEKQYTLVGTNMSGINAFFVRNDCLNDSFADLNVEQLYNPPRYYKEFFSGHPSLYCLKDLPEGRKQLFCGKEEMILYREGFHSQENSEGTFCWMSEVKSVLWIKDEGNKLSKIVLKIGSPALTEQSNADGKIPNVVRVKIEDEMVYEGKLEQAEMTFEIAFERKNSKEDEVIELEIETDCLWTPYDVGMGEDRRRLGLCVHEIELV